MVLTILDFQPEQQSLLQKIQNRSYQSAYTFDFLIKLISGLCDYLEKSGGVYPRDFLTLNSDSKGVPDDEYQLSKTLYQFQLRLAKTYPWDRDFIKSIPILEPYLNGVFN